MSRDKIMDDPVRCVRGILSGIILSLPLWGLLYFAFRLILLWFH